MALLYGLATSRSSGPIEFLGEEPPHDLGGTEFGGVSGLVQPEKGETLKGDPDASGGHVWSKDAVGGGVNAEVSQAITRAGGVPLNPREAVTGVSDTGEEVVDPVTGRVVPAEFLGSAPDLGDEVGGLSDLQP